MQATGELASFSTVQVTSNPGVLFPNTKKLEFLNELSTQITYNQWSNLIRCLFLSLVEISTRSLKSPGESPAGRYVITGTAEHLLVWPHYLVIFAKRNLKNKSSQRAGKPHDIPGWWRKESTSCVIEARQPPKCVLWMTQRGFSIIKRMLPATRSD